MNVKLFVVAVLLIVFCLLIVNVKANVDEVDTYFENVRGQLLAFYGSEIISHAGIILGLVIGLPPVGTLFWKRLHFRNAFLRYFTRMLVLVFVVMVILYSVGRLIYWSSLGASLTQATRTNLGVVVPDSNTTSYMSALTNYGQTQFWNDPSFTGDIARRLYPSWNLPISGIMYVGQYWIIPSFILTCLQFLYNFMTRYFDRKRRTKEVDRYLESLGF